MNDMIYDNEDEMGADAEGEDSPEVEIENLYSNAKAIMDEEPKEAIKGFEKMLELEKQKGDWGFKALKQLTLVYFKLGDSKKVLDKFKKFMEHAKSFVTPNYAEKGINSILDHICSGKNIELTENMFHTALESLAKGHERVWFRTNLKLGKFLYDNNEYGKLPKVLLESYNSCKNEKGDDDQRKGSQLVDVYALEIQMYTATKNNKKLKELYHKALDINSAISHPRTMGVIRECGGKMHMREKEWGKAHTDFFEAFKNYDEAGNPRRTQCLKYLVLANMLKLSQINPFDSTEAKPYKNDPEILVMTNLVSAYERNDIKSFEKILKDNRQSILEDSFMRDYIEDLMKNIRTQVLLTILIPYKKIRIPFIAAELNITAKQVEDLLVSLILDNKIRGQIDQVNQLLELESSKSSSYRKYVSISKWAHHLSIVQGSVMGKLA